MAEVNVENMEENESLFMEKMGFARDTDGLELSDDQLVNFLLLCLQKEYGIGEEEAEEEGVKVKVIKMNGGDMSNMMDEILGQGGPSVDY
jgi:pyruvate/oxaloacetate carboxyltransferase